MNIKFFYSIFVVLLFLAWPKATISAQQSNYPVNAYYYQAVDLFEKGQYADAELQFRKALESCSPDDKILRGHIAAYRALSAIELRQPNAESMVLAMEEEFGNMPKTNELCFALAKQCYYEGNYRKAVIWFEKTDNRELSSIDRVECLFLQGHACFQINNYKKALPLFTSVKNQADSKYKLPATYYYAHIEYKNQNWAAALEGFQAIRHDDRFSVLAGYYILHIHSMQGRYNEVIEEGGKLLQTATDNRYQEIALLIVDACCRTEQYTLALDYFNLYKSNAVTLSRNDQFTEAVIYYHLQEYNEALNRLKPAMGSDSLGQAAAYYAGATAIKTNDNIAALKYFDTARQANFNRDIKHDAWLNYVKLSMEVDSNTKPLYEYQKQYPNRDIPQLQATAYMLDKQYDKALSILSTIPQLSDKDKGDIQRIAFAQGISRFEKKQYFEAVQSFDKSLQYAQYDNNIATTARYWKAEALYEQKQYEEARKLYEAFINSPGAFRTGKEYRLAHYNIGYCFFKQKNYTEAGNWFRKFTGLSGNDNIFIGNAYCRIADCFFIQKRYSNAIENYDRAIKLKTAETDYALFQKALSQGLNEQKQDRKLETLSALLQQFPNSEYVPAAHFEIGRTYVRLNNYGEANKAFHQIINNYKTNPYAQRAFIELGLISVNQGNNKQAIDYYKSAVLANPSTKEAQDALIGLKNAYIETNDVDSYFAFTKSLADYSGGSEGEMEEARFAAAEKTYLVGDCEATIATLSAFRQTYPNSKNNIQVNFYLGDCSYRSNDIQTAYTCFSYVVNQATNAFTDPALLGLARSAEQLELYSEASAAYSRLYAVTKDEEHTLKAALLKGKSQVLDGDDEAAFATFNELAEGHVATAEGAEAAYLAIAVLYKQQKEEEAINAVFVFSDTKTPHQYWVARAFILLGDIYVDKQDIEQAKSTYESILNGYRNKTDDILDTVEKRLASIQ
ncbi:MAG: tetratricopeptide repeat protein [Bacteroidales bacterium]|nr:tetratricopeptide repeat protein [Bacteroidales bacterium]MCL2133318.1 tetratricopeptide repeat protein [Bacteroidales bacterium]